MKPESFNPDQIAKRARIASRKLASIPTPIKNQVLTSLAAMLADNRHDILAANQLDITASRSAGRSDAKLRRLELTTKSVDQMAQGLEQVAKLPDPVGAVVKEYNTDAGLHVQRVRVPLGVIMMIYEARPNVTIDAFALCFKSGNACLLKGGREANRSNRVLANLATESLKTAALDSSCIELITTSDRDEIRHLLTLRDSIDLVIPRGGEELIRFVHQHSRIPTVLHFKGVCHIYVDEHADLAKALEICVTAKTSAPATCNAAECILIHQAVAGRFMPQLAARYADAHVEMRGDQRSVLIAPTIKPASPEDYGREFLDLVVAVKIVPDIDAAIDHVQRYGSNHTEAIVTENVQCQSQFVKGVDASCVLLNASTRFNDGFQLGLGAEIGISTSKIHAYGPMGLEELTTQRYVIQGTGQVR